METKPLSVSNAERTASLGPRGGFSALQQRRRLSRKELPSYLPG